MLGYVLKENEHLFLFLLSFVVWTADVMAGVEAAILDSDVNLRMEAIQGVATIQ